MIRPRPSGRPLSLWMRLMAGALIWLVLMLTAGGLALAWAFQDTVERQFSQKLDAMLRGLMTAAEQQADGSWTVSRSLGDPRFDQIYSGLYWQISDPTGRRLWSRSLWDGSIATAAGGPDLQVRTGTGPRGETLLIAERDVRFDGSDAVIHILVAGDLADVADEIRRFHLLLAVASALLGLGLGLGIFLQIRFGLKPLRGLAADLAAIGQGRNHRLSGRYPGEIAPLVQAMNDVLDKDAQLIERARTHVGNLAHGLKTPLSVIAAEAASQPDPVQLRRQVDAMRHLINHHLGRARAAAGAGRVLGLGCPVADVAQKLVAVLSRLFAERGLNIRLDVPAPVLFLGHREDLEEILGNLLENACKWAHSTISLTVRSKDGHLIMVVQDDGPGLPPDQLAQAAQRGRRLDEQAPGWGLGLSIVADLAQLHGGTITLDRAAMGGLRVCVSLPDYAVKA